MDSFRLDRSAAFLAIDMQRLFAEPGPWQVPWLSRVLPQVAELAERHPERTVFTRFIPPRDASEMPGAWRDYYERWAAMTRENLDPQLLGLVDPLARLTPPAWICDKAAYSAFSNRKLRPWLVEHGIETLIVAGGETDVCVLSTVMSAVDLGYRVLLASDALCSADDSTHDALMLLYSRRYSQQVQTATAAAILSAWS
jgi:nicotinamidase-related amidase